MENAPSGPMLKLLVFAASLRRDSVNDFDVSIYDGDVEGSVFPDMFSLAMAHRVFAGDEFVGPVLA